MKLSFRLRVSGVEHLPQEGPFVLAPNHVSHLDPIVIAATLPYSKLAHIYWAARPGVTQTSWIRRWGSRRAKTIPVGGRTPGRTSLACGDAVLRQGNALVWFPEGTRSADGKLRPFKSGLGILLKQHACPVVPVVLSGFHEAMPRGSRMPKWFSKLSVHYGTPLSPADLEHEGEGDEPADRIVSALREHMLKMQKENSKSEARNPKRIRN